MFDKEQAAAVRAGTFVVISLVGMAVIIFVLGTERGLFKQQYEIKTTFTNVRGLREGAPVRLAGMGVGEVSAILFPEDLAEKHVEIALQIDRGVKNRIREDSVATINWLSFVTGDSYVEISIGGSEKPAVNAGGFIRGVQPIDFSAALEGSIDVLNSFAGSFRKLEEEGFFETLNGAVRSLQSCTAEIKDGEGLMHAMIFDPEGGKILGTMAEGAQAFKEIVLNLQDGNNLLNAMLYDNEFRLAAEEFMTFPERISEILNQVSNSKGLLHSLLNDPEKADMLDDLAVTIENLKVITDKTSAGEGTLGAILNDPTLYDDLKMLLQGAERSFVLRKLIRSSLEDAKKVDTD